MGKLRAAALLGAATSVSLLMMAGGALAGHLKGVEMPDTIQVNGETLSLNGMGMREATFLKVDVYVAGLYVPEPTSNPRAILEADEAKQLHLVFVRDVDRDDIVDAWIEGFENNVGDDPALETRIDRLNDWMTDLDEGDTLTFTYVPSKGTFVDVRGQRKGVIEGADFARALFAIWLGDEPPNRGLKRGLLEGG